MYHSMSPGQLQEQTGVSAEWVINKNESSMHECFLASHKVTQLATCQIGQSPFKDIGWYDFSVHCATRTAVNSATYVPLYEAMLSRFIDLKVKSVPRHLSNKMSIMSHFTIGCVFHTKNVNESNAAIIYEPWRHCNANSLIDDNDVVIGIPLLVRNWGRHLLTHQKIERCFLCMKLTYCIS